jgi:membrane associated rhomboid family serine protease
VSPVVEVEVRRAPDAAAVAECALVLAAAGIPHRVAVEQGESRLLVPEGDAPGARSSLDAYEAERAAEPACRPARPVYGRSLLGLAVALGLAAFHALAGGRAEHGAWVAAGQASAARVVDGEIWRAVTALTLHTDVAHLAGNMLAAAVFVTAAAHEVGPGVATWLVLLAGAGGNTANAFARGGGHTTVGASSAIFGAVGLLGGLGFGRRQGARGAWLPLAGSLALLGMLGTGERADLGAHLFGFACGGAFGVAAAQRRAAPPGAGTQSLLAALALAAIAGCWYLALR